VTDLGNLPADHFELQVLAADRPGEWKTITRYQSIELAEAAVAAHHERFADETYRLIRFVPFEIHRVTARPGTSDVKVAS
jgi:hypothetical protein